MTALLADNTVGDRAVAADAGSRAGSDVTRMPLSLGMVVTPEASHRVPDGVPAVPEGVLVGAVEMFSTSTTLYTHLLGCVDLPLRVAGETQYRLPAEWTTLAPVIARTVAVEHANNANWVDYHAYLSVTCVLVDRGVGAPEFTSPVRDETGAAGSSAQGSGRTYVASSNGGAVVGLGAENVMCFTDGHDVLVPGLAARTGMRTLVRVTFAKGERRGGTPNPLIAATTGR